jgi:hypothetical protein
MAVSDFQVHNTTNTDSERVQQDHATHLLNDLLISAASKVVLLRQIHILGAGDLLRADVLSVYHLLSRRVM